METNWQTQGQLVAAEFANRQLFCMILALVNKGEKKDS